MSVRITGNVLPRYGLFGVIVLIADAPHQGNFTAVGAYGVEKGVDKASSAQPHLGAYGTQTGVIRGEATCTRTAGRSAQRL